MNEINDEIARIADDACAYLESQIKRLRSVTSCEDAEKMMHDVADYLFPQINCYTLFSHLVRCVKIDKEKENSESITHMERFWFPPENCVRKPGRMNIPKVPIFYASHDHIKASLLETNITEGDEFYAGVWSVDENASMLSYPCIPYDILCDLSSNGDENALKMKNCIDSFPCIRRMTDLIGKAERV